ncbi:acyltransferase domain-containing protein, partial [Streptomyces sp. MH13]|uniref:acyltransferase domain-containing protein n=1 Tax=Streptomyces sp. MH13 TaxID=3417651 RepID=UPI003CE939DF
SGKSVEAVRAQAGRLLEWVDARPGVGVRDVGLSLAVTRSVFDHRVAVVGGDRGELLAGLRAVAGGEPVSGVFQGRVRAGVSGVGVGVLFSGQGSQCLGMGRRLYESSVVFARAFDAVVAELDRYVERPLKGVVWGEDPGLLQRTGWAQPALFAVEVALFRVLESWGVVPGYLLGHSVGEVAAAHVSGVLSLADACVLVAARGRLMDALPSGGAMVAVEASEAEVAGLLSSGRVSVAAVNSPGSVVIAGDEGEVVAVAQGFARQGRRTSRLRVSHAFHSPLMEPMLDEFERVLGGLSWSAPRIPVVSNLTGEPVDAELLCSAGYWVRQVRETVRFADGVRWLRSRGVRTLVEAGPGGVLSAMAQQAGAEEVTAVALLGGPDTPEDTALAAAAARLFVQGVPVVWESLFAGARHVELPTYA